VGYDEEIKDYQEQLALQAQGSPKGSATTEENMVDLSYLVNFLI